MARQKHKPPALDLPVSFSNVSVGVGTARIGITIDRQHFSVAAADSALCGRRLTGTLRAIPPGDEPGQTYLPGTEPQPTELVGVFDVKSFSANRKRISAGLTFALAGLDIGTVCAFAQRVGRLIVNEVADLLPDEDGDEDGDEDE